jgi:hypothetical protein
MIPMSVWSPLADRSIANIHKLLLTFGVALLFSSIASADQASYVNAGGTTLSGGNTVASGVNSPAGTLTIGAATTGGSISFLSSDGTTNLTATFITASLAESCYGGGRGGHITCGYTLNGTFQGTITINGSTQAIIGTTYQVFGTGGVAASGITGWHSAYSPFYYTDSNTIYRSDDLKGTNQVAYSGPQQFFYPGTLAVDAQGRIYVADLDCRIIRIDDMKGTNWTTYGSCGSGGPGLFGNISHIVVDSLGRIYVTDPSNSQIVRMDDMNGTNWTTFSNIGSGTGQISSSFGSIAVDSNFRIYIADAGNNRIVRMDDMLGTNWTALTQSPQFPGYYYTIVSPSVLAVNAQNQIYFVDTSSLVRVDDMTGANWTMVGLGSCPSSSLTVDYGGTPFLGAGQLFTGGGMCIFPGMSTSLASSGTVGASAGPSYVWGVTPAPLSSPLPPALSFSSNSLTFANQNINTVSTSQPVTLNNFGGSPLNLSFAPTNGYTVTSNCPTSLIAGSSCTASVSFAPNMTGAIPGLVTMTDNSGNLGSTQTVSTNGFATAPALNVAPSALSFPGQVVKTTSAAESVVLKNTGNGPLAISSVAAPAPFSQTNNCATVAPGAACTISVTFTPQSAASVSGALVVATNAGGASVPLAGSGVASAAVVTVSPSALLFPQELVGAKSAVQTITLTNTGKTAVTNKGVSVTGNFSETTTCTSSLAAGKSCTISVYFAPAATGTLSGTLSVALSTGTATVSLAGTGTDGSLPSALTVTPATLSFLNYIVGDNPSQTVTVTNATQASVGIGGITMSGDPSLTQKNKCSSILAAGASCTISVTFRPTIAGSFTSTLVLSESSGSQDLVSISAFASISGN